MKRNFWIFLIVAILISSVSVYALLVLPYTNEKTVAAHQVSPKPVVGHTTVKKLVLSEQDKKEIIISILKKTDFLNSYDNELEKTCILYLSKANLPESFITENQPKLKGVSKIIFMTPDYSVKGTERKTTYWEFRSFDIEENKVSVSFFVFYSGGNSSWGIYEYKKTESGKWEGKAEDFGAAAS